MDRTGERLHKVADALSVPSPEMLYRRLVSHWDEASSVVLDGNEPLTSLVDPQQWARAGSYVEWMMYMDLVSYLPDDILVKVDRASMGVGLEARVPFIDHRVVEFAWRLPLQMRIRAGQGKWVLRKLLDKYVPREMMDRPKMGFGVPIDSWLRGPLREWVEDLLDEDRLRREGYLRAAPIRQKWSEHLSGKRNWQYYLWDVLMFQTWLQEQTA
jgi:asparagine synthase (glutamine-hydrolysing)